jgi:hypothetical protein
MTLSNQQRADRCQKAITGYSDDDTYTNLVDLLADAMHFCHANGHSVADIFDTALMHFEAKIGGEDISDDLNHEATNERNEPLTESKTAQPDSQRNHLRSVADDALEAFWQVVVQRYPQAETGDLSPMATIRLQTAAENAIAEWIDNNVPSITTTGD